MNYQVTAKLTTLASAVALLAGLSFNAQAQQAGTAPALQPMPVQGAPMQAPRTPYGSPYRGAPMQNNNTPWGGNNRFGNMPWGGGNNTPWGGNNNRFGNMPWGGGNNTPWGGNNNRFGNMPWGGNNNRFGNMPWGGGNNTPWGGNNNRFGNMPWGGGNNSPWGGNRKGFGQGMPFESNFTPWSRRFWDDLGEGGRNPMRNMDDWFRPGEPKEGAAQMWDDLLNAPSDMGTMPGGWTAPSISVPNPIDVGDEFSDAARDMPDEMSNQMDNINIQTW